MGNKELFIGAIAAVIAAALAVAIVYFVFLRDKEDGDSSGDTGEGGGGGGDSSNDDILAVLQQLQSTVQDNTSTLQAQIDDVDTSVGSLNLFTYSIDTKATDAQADAAEALANSSSAGTAAMNAQADATQALANATTNTGLVAAAQTDATTALANATTNTGLVATAQTDATTALANATTNTGLVATAQTDAATAQTDATTALTNATTNSGLVATAQTDANQALTNAATNAGLVATAQTDANQALTDASSASSTATTAQSDATQALTDAATANTTINGIISEIDVKLTCSTGTADACFALGVEEFKFDNNQPAAMALNGLANYQGNTVELKPAQGSNRGAAGVNLGKPCGDNWELRYIVRHTGTTSTGADAFGAFANSDELYAGDNKYNGAIQTEVDIYNGGSFVDRLGWFKNDRGYQFSSANFTKDTGSFNRFEYRLRRSGDTYTWEARGLDTSFEFSDTRTITGMQTTGNYIGVYAFSGGIPTKFDLDYLEFKTFPEGTNTRSWLS